MRSDTLKKQCIPILAVAAGLVLSSLACTSIMPPTPTPTPTDTPTPTNTSTPTSTPTITPTFTPSMTPTQSYTDWPVVLSDSFDDNTNNWYEGSSTDAFTKSVVNVTNGQYLIDVTAIQPFSWSLPPVVRNLSNFYLTADVQNITGPASADYGVAFRINSSNKYYFCIGAQDQMYSFQVLNNGNWSTIIEWANSSQINTDGTNTIGVLAKGTSFTFFINGEQVDQADDSTLKTGKVGVGLSLAKAGDKMQVAFDNFEVQAPQTGG